MPHDTNLPGSPAIRYWPRTPTAPDPRVETNCGACGARWWIALAMAGHRLRCDCGAWIDVPAIDGEGALSVRPDEKAIAPFNAERGVAVDPAVGYSEPAPSHEPIVDIATNLPMQPGTLEHANLRTKRRWMNRGVFELIAVVAAFLVPHIVFSINTTEKQSLLLMPIADVISGIAVLLIGAFAPHYTFEGLRPPKSERAYGEAILVAGGTLALALGWGELLSNIYGSEGPNMMEVLREGLGFPLGFAVIAISPAIFEEIAFRGLVQGRMSALYGRSGGILIAGTAFALAHGVTSGLPFHVGLGFYLCWLRARCGSLYPPMLVHLLYNGGLYLTLSGGV